MLSSSSSTLPNPGATMFFSARLADTNSSLLTGQIGSVRHALRVTQNRFPIQIDAIVVLPSVMHTIWTLPSQDEAWAARWRMFKANFVKAVARIEGEDGAALRDPIWARHLWHHRLNDRQTFLDHQAMIHQAPVEYGLVEDAREWPFSSLHSAREHASATAA